VKKNWNEMLFGHVRVTVRGRIPEAFINRCVKESIAIWDIERVGDREIVCSLMLKDIRRIKPILKATDCRIHFEGRSGLPFLIRRLLSRTGILIGILFAFALIFILSNMVWRIDVSGADPVVEKQIRSALKKMNVHVGSLTFFLPSLETIEDELLGQIKKATWIGVSKDGTTYHVDIVQKELPPREKETGPRDLIATKEAKIRRIFVEKGVAVVEPDQVVEPGQLLVSGSIGNEDNPKFVAAKGKVMGETWYRSDVSVPLKTAYTTMTGDIYRKHQLKVFGWSLPIWGFKSHPYKEAHVDREIKPFHFLFWDLPVSYERITYRKTDSTHRQLTMDEALAIGKETAANQLLQKLSEDARVLAIDIRKRFVENGELHLNLLMTVEEDITKPRVIIPSERIKHIRKEKEKKAPAS